MSVSTEHIGAVELRIPAKASWVAVARLAVAAVANQLPFPLDAIEDLKLALTEACTKCIENVNDANATIDITFEVMADAVRIIVRGPRSEQKSAAMSVVTGQGRGDQTEGLGIYIIQSLMDDVEYRVDAHTGTELVMLKHVPS